MKRFFEIKKQVVNLFGFFTLMGMIVLAVVIKERDIQNPSGAQNLEATYHALLTIESLRQNDIREHWLLPIVTLGQDNDAFIPWGATVPTNSGRYIYTSFTPCGFLLPYMVFEMLDLKATVKNLARMNMTIGAIAGIALYFLVIRLLLQLGLSRRLTIVAALTSVSIAFFSREALLATGIIYWPHALYQIMLLASLHLLFNILTEPVGSRSWRVSSRILYLSLFLGAWTEWTGYVFNLGLVFILWFQTDKPELRKLALKVIVVTTCAGLVTLLHYGLAVGFQESSHAFIGRFFARSTQSGSFSELIGGYGLSYGIYLLVVLVVIIKGYLFGAGSAQSAINNQQAAIIPLVLLASILPLIENLIMLQHATEFSFDRLKFIIPSAIVIALAFTNRGVWLRLFVVTSIALAGVHGYKTHQNNMNHYSEWSRHHQANIALVERLMTQVDLNCATFASNLGVRGYANLLIGRSIYEYKSLDQALALNEQRGGCAAIFLEGRWVFPDLQRYSQAIVTWPNGRRIILAEGDIR